MLHEGGIVFNVRTLCIKFHLSASNTVHLSTGFLSNFTALTIPECRCNMNPTVLLFFYPSLLPFLCRRKGVEMQRFVCLLSASQRYMWHTKHVYNHCGILLYEYGTRRSVYTVLLSFSNVWFLLSAGGYKLRADIYNETI